MIVRGRKGIVPLLPSYAYHTSASQDEMIYKNCSSVTYALQFLASQGIDKNLAIAAKEMAPANWG